MTDFLGRLLGSEPLTNLFLKLLNMSFSAAWLVGAVLLLRLMLRKAPKWVNVLLWGMVALRLLCPFTLESTLSLMPKAQVVTPEIMLSDSPAIDSGMEAVDQVVNPILSEAFTPHPAASADPLQILIPVFSLVWLTGVALMGLYTLVSYWRIRHKVRMAIRVEPDIYLSEYVDSPFVLGLFRPRIYMPYHMTSTDRRLVLAHERSHIHRKDHWWKPLGFALLTLHWFNPVMWAAYIFLCRDIELACDERVIQEMEPEDRANYSQALLNCSAHRKAIAACPLAFGEVGVKERVKHVLRYKKPGFWVVSIALVLCSLVAVCFLTDPEESIAQQILKESNGYRILWQQDKSVEFSVPTDSLPAACYTRQGADVEIPSSYQRSSGSIFLTHGALGGSGETLELTFSLRYKKEDLDTAILVPYRNGQVTLSLPSSAVTASDGTVFPNACSLVGPGAGESFVLSIQRELWDSAAGNLIFQVDGFQLLSYTKFGLFRDKTPYPITKNLQGQLPETVRLTLWEGESSQPPISLEPEEVAPLLDALSGLVPEDFENGAVTSGKATLMLLFGETGEVGTLKLDTDGEYVQFTFFDDTVQDALDHLAWYVKDEDLNAFFADYLPITDGEEWGVTLEAERVSRTGATVVFRTPAEGSFFTGSHFTLQTLTNGKWADLPALQEPVFTTEAISINNIHRFKIDWEWLYGELPGGQYRIGKSISRDTFAQAPLPKVDPVPETATVYAEFTLPEISDSPYWVTRDFATENLGATADFLLDGSSYTLSPEEVQELVSLLAVFSEESFYPIQATDAKTQVHLWNGDMEILLYSDGIQVAFQTPLTGNLWAVENVSLNDFIRRISKHAQSESVYEIYNVSALDELDDHYSMEAAIADQVVVMVDGDVQNNQQVWMDFWAKSNRGQAAWVRCMDVSAEGEASLYDVEFNRKNYTLRYLRNGEVFENTYAYLKVFSGVFPNNAAADLYTYYVLVNDNTATWEDLWQGAASSALGVYIPFHFVYQDIEILPENAFSPPVSDSVTPENIRGIQRAELNWLEPVELTDPDILNRLEEMLRNSTEAPGIACPTGNTLTLSLSSGALLQLDMSSDGCGVWKAGDVYYKYASGNEEFYSFFAAQVVHTRLYGGAELDTLEEALPYFNWSHYANLYGPELTFSLMDHMGGWAKQQTEPEKLSLVLYRTEGLDGAYAEYYGDILNDLYEADPKDFAFACLGDIPVSKGQDPLAIRETVIALLANARGIRQEDAMQLLLDDFSGES